MDHESQTIQQEGRKIEVSREDESHARQPRESQGGEGGEEKRHNLTAQFARESIDYDPETGVLRWKKRPRHHFKAEKQWKIFNTQFAGKITGCRDGKGYLQVRFSGLGLFFNHRLAFLIHHGWLPDIVDHKNGKRSDNRIINLREASPTTSLYNRTKTIRNKSGHKGVSWHKYANKWVAEIFVEKKKIYLGVFENIEDAVSARNSAELLYHGEYASILRNTTV